MHAEREHHLLILLHILAVVYILYHSEVPTPVRQRLSDILARCYQLIYAGMIALIGAAQLHPPTIVPVTE